MNIILTAGRSTRLMGISPYGCKALTPVLGRPAIEWQLDVLQSATIVCRSEHARFLEGYGDIWPCDDGGGPVGALRAVDLTGPVTVVFADTLFTELPDGPDWVGVAPGGPGRKWDVVDATGRVAYRETEGEWVCVGAYRFSNHLWLDAAVDHAWRHREGEVGMGEVVNRHPNPTFAPVPSWMDIGDAEAWANTCSRLAGVHQWKGAA